MSITDIRPRRTDLQERIEPQMAARGNYAAQATTSQFAPKPKPVPPGPHQIGNVTLAAVDQLTDMSADELDKLADSVEGAGREMGDDIRELARRIRKSGAFANAQLSNFVRVAATVADSARELAKHVDLRNEPQAEPTEAKQDVAAAAAQLDKVQATISEIIGTPGAADHAEA